MAAARPMARPTTPAPTTRTCIASTEKTALFLPSSAMASRHARRRARAILYGGRRLDVNCPDASGADLTFATHQPRAREANANVRIGPLVTGFDDHRIEGMQKASALQIRTMTRNDLDLAVEWAAREGWNPGLADAACFHAADPEGFLVGCLSGEPVGCISAVAYGPTFGFLGFYIVKPDLRGRGYGYLLWQAGMARLENRVVGLDGVIAQQENYKRSGFVFAHRNIRFGGVPNCEHDSDPRLTPIRAELEETILAYDRAFFPASRDTFLRC